MCLFVYVHSSGLLFLPEYAEISLVSLSECECFPNLCTISVACNFPSVCMCVWGSSVTAFALYVNVFPGDLGQSVPMQE